MKLIIIIIFSTFCLISCHKVCTSKKISKIEIKNTPNSNINDTIISLAEKEWLKIYGKNIYKKKPFTVRAKNDSIWIVEGTLPKDYDGGVPYAEVNIKSYRVINISHGK